MGDSCVMVGVRAWHAWLTFVSKEKYQLAWNYVRIFWFGRMHYGVKSKHEKAWMGTYAKRRKETMRR